MLSHSGAHGVHAVTAEDAAAGEEAAVLPVGKAKLRAVERELAVDPASEAVPDEGGIHGGIEALGFHGILGEKRGHEAGTVAIEEADGMVQVVDDRQGDFRGRFPFPLATEVALGKLGDPWLFALSVGPVDCDTALPRGTQPCGGTSCAVGSNALSSSSTGWLML